MNPTRKKHRKYSFLKFTLMFSGMKGPSESHGALARNKLE